VAAASVVAKVTRDRIMTEMHQRFPDYGFAAHKGYVTPEHAAALEAWGPCAEHRRSYVNVARAATECGLGDNAPGSDDVSVEIA
jgi:ribonuclease HII